MHERKINLPSDIGYLKRNEAINGQRASCHMVFFPNPSADYSLKVVEALPKKSLPLSEKVVVQRELMESHIAGSMKSDLYDYFPLNSTSHIARRIHALVATNGPFYVHWGDLKEMPPEKWVEIPLGAPIGVFKVDKDFRNSFPAKKRPYVGIKESGEIEILHELGDPIEKSNEYEYFFAAGPSLFINSEMVLDDNIFEKQGFDGQTPPLSLTKSLYEYRAARLLLATLKNKSQEYSCLFVVEAINTDSKTGLTLNEFCMAFDQVCSANDFRVIDAIYIDGGAATTLVGSDFNVINVPSGISNPQVSGEKAGEEKPVASALCVVAKGK